MSQLIVPQAYLTKNSGLNSNIDFALLSPEIILVQELRLRPLLGTNLYNEIITQTTPTVSLTAANRTLMDNYIAPFMVMYVKSKAVNATKYQFTNTGPITISENAISDTKAKELTDDYKNYAEEYGQLMINFINANPGDYPAYFTNTGVGDVVPDGNAFDTQIYISGKSRRKENDLDND